MSQQAGSTEEYFKSSRLRVIGAITAAVVLVGALGGLAGIAFDPEPVDEAVVTPVSGAPSGSGAEGRPLFPAAALGADDTGGARAPSRGTYLRLDTGIDFWLPRGWHVDHGTQYSAYLSNGKGGYAYVVTGQVNPAARAGQVITANRKILLPPANYTQLQTKGPVRWADPYGSVRSTAMMHHWALWADNQGSAPIYGQIYAGVRNDGMALITVIETIPPEKFASTFPPSSGAGLLVSNSFGRFGGVA